MNIVKSVLLSFLIFFLSNIEAKSNNLICQNDLSTDEWAEIYYWSMDGSDLKKTALLNFDKDYYDRKSSNDVQNIVLDTYNKKNKSEKDWAEIYYWSADGSDLKKIALLNFDKDYYELKSSYDNHNYALNLYNNDNKTDKDWSDIYNNSKKNSDLQKTALRNYDKDNYDKKISYDNHEYLIKLCNPKYY